MKLSRIKNVFAWALVLGLLISCGVAYRIIAAGGIKGTPTSTSNNLRQPIASNNGLIAWYPLDGDTKDYGGNHYDGTLNSFTFDGTTNGWTVGKFGKGLLFNGSSDYIATPSLTLLNAITFSAWVNASTLSAGYHSIIRGGMGQFALYRYGNIFNFYDNYQAENKSLISTAVIVGTWYHVVGTYDGSTKVIYINGVQVNSASSTAINTGISNFVIGSDSYNQAFSGAIDDVRIYNRALTASEISNLYAGSPSQNCDQTCKIWLKFDDNSGTTAKDSVGTYPGTLSGSTTWTTGNFASAVKLDGSTGYVSVPDLGMTAGTVGIWINPATVSGDQRLLAQASGAATQAGQIALNQSSGTVRHGSGFPATA